MANNVATCLNGTIFKSLKAEVWTDEEVENYLKIKFSCYEKVYCYFCFDAHYFYE